MYENDKLHKEHTGSYVTRIIQNEIQIGGHGDYNPSIDSAFKYTLIWI
jgi:hypothetical protein